MENQINNTTVTAPDIVCGGCASAIKNALGKVEGIAQVDVDIEKKTVSIAHSDTVNREKIVEVLDDAGFPAD